MREYGQDRIWPFAQGGGSTIMLSTLAIGLAIMLRMAWSNLVTGLLLVMTFAVWLLVLYFFRDPNRETAGEAGVVLGPGDGEIVEIIRTGEDRYLNTEALRISLFLSIIDVHVQRVPLAGRVTEVDHQAGKFLKAFKPEASDVNEYIATVLDSEFGRILVKQIAGILARRCVNYLKPGDIVKSGQRFGLIRFGSRIDLFLPLNARLMVAVGDKVYGGLTRIAQLQAVNTE